MSSISHLTYPRLARASRSFLQQHYLLHRLLHPLIQVVRAIHAFITDYRVIRDNSRQNRTRDKVRRVSRLVRTHLLRPRTVLFYPEVPNHRYTIRTVLTRLGVTITSDPDTPAEAAFLWKDETVFVPEPYQSAFVGFGRVLNAHCTDISKSRVGTCFRKAFGYDVTVDPLRYTGAMAVKSEQNAVHDGRAVNGPILNREPDTVYQRLIDNTVGPGLCVDYRVPIIDGSIPAVYLRFRRCDERFESNYIKWVLVDVDDVLSTNEQQRLHAFSTEIGLDCGELDVLRDRSDGRIYVVDCNNTPWAPARLMTRPARAEAVERLMPAVDDLIRSSS